MKLNSNSIRAQFPALRRRVNGELAAYLDGPGGTQAPQSVIDAMSGLMQRGGSNHGGLFVTGWETDAAHEAAREAMADLLHAHANEVAFGQNMTSLTFAFSRAVSRTWQPADELIVTWLEHDANIAPWLLAAEDRGVKVRWLDINPADGTLRYDLLPDLLNERTRLLAITWASNALGSITQLQRVVRLAHDAGALVYVDAVHYAPHDLIDVQAVDCDFLVCSAYKFFGPHTGVFYGKYDLLDSIRAYRVRPAPADPPGKWETGTQSFESLAGVRAAVDYLASLGEGTSRRARLVDAMAQIKAHGEMLSRRFLEGARDVPGLRVYGITGLDRLAERTPTFAVSLAGYRPDEVARLLGEQGIFVWNGDYYAVAPMERLGVLDKGGLVRIGFTHYNTEEEVDRVLCELLALARKRA
jgi:cysteine desulfurase family protein (TIGR01976 family)